MSVLTAPHPTSPRPQPRRPQPVHVVRLEPDGYAAWDRFVDQAPDGTLFHGTAWLEAVRTTFGHVPHYLMARRGEGIVAALPLFEVGSLLGGTLLVSVPYGVYGGPIGDDAEAVAELCNAAAVLAWRRGARVVEMRSPRARWPGVPVVDRYVTFRRALPDRAADCLSQLPRKARAAARSARERHGLVVDFDDRHLPAVWRLYCAGMARLASLSYPYRFFRELIDRTPKCHIVSLISREDRPVAGLVTFLHKGVAMPYFVGADHRAQRMNANNFVYLTAMERAVELGCHTFDFGRSRRDNLGACAFKRNQGFAAEPLEYQVYTPPGQTRPDLSPTNPRFRWARRVWPMLPGAVSRPLGAWLSAHVPG